jgi:hypothetical protein
MMKPVPCPPAQGPLEDYGARFDDLFPRVAQRRGFREYLAGLLAPRDRNKTLTALSRRPGRSMRRCSGCSSSCRSPGGIRSGAVFPSRRHRCHFFAPVLNAAKAAGLF